MARHREPSRGDDLADRMATGIGLTESAPVGGARDLPVLRGMTKHGEFVTPVENVTVQVADILVGSVRVFTYGQGVFLQADLADGAGDRLVALRTGGRVEAGAEDLLGNLFVCEDFVKGQAVQFPPPRGLIDLVMRSELVLPRLPRIALYSRIPVYDADFVLCGPGWHPASGVLVHGPAVEPAAVEPGAPSAPAPDRLPRHLRTLLAGFCFASGADLANAVGVLVTGLLVNHFVVPLKPVVLLDGNQPGVGKTLLARVVGLLLAGADPRLIPYTPDDEELGKRVCATLRGGQAGVLIFDNAKARGGSLDSVVVESNSTAPEISIRVLGVSENYTRPNDVIWFLTMNGTKASPDLVSRALPVRLAYEGDPGGRAFAGPDPIGYARGHRLELLGELAGLVELWKRSGRPEGTRPHRCGHWARVVGGVLHAAGFLEFLSNADEAAASFDTALDDLAALAEAAASRGPPHFFDAAPATAGGRVCTPESTGASAKDWESIFVGAKVLSDELASSKSARGKTTKVGQFLSPLVGREVRIDVQGRTGRATLRFVSGRANTKRYCFEILWDEVPTPHELPAPVSERPLLGETSPLQLTPPATPAPVTVPSPIPPPCGNVEEWV